jgi:hypothetical protein
MNKEEIDDFLDREDNKRRVGKSNEMINEGMMDFSNKAIWESLEGIEKALIEGGKMTANDGFYFSYINKYFTKKMINEVNNAIDIKKEPKKYIEKEKKAKIKNKIKEF